MRTEKETEKNELRDKQQFFFNGNKTHRKYTKVHVHAQKKVQEQENKFIYSSTTITADSKYTPKIKPQTGKAKTAFIT